MTYKVIISYSWFAASHGAPTDITTTKPSSQAAEGAACTDGSRFRGARISPIEGVVASVSEEVYPPRCGSGSRNLGDRLRASTMGGRPTLHPTLFAPTFPFYPDLSRADWERDSDPSGCPYQPKAGILEATPLDGTSRVVLHRLHRRVQLQPFNGAKS
jgi:hypothetical protein